MNAKSELQKRADRGKGKATIGQTEEKKSAM